MPAHHHHPTCHRCVRLLPAPPFPRVQFMPHTHYCYLPTHATMRSPCWDHTPPLCLPYYFCLFVHLDYSGLSLYLQRRSPHYWFVTYLHYWDAVLFHLYYYYLRAYIYRYRGAMVYVFLRINWDRCIHLGSHFTLPPVPATYLPPTYPTTFLYFPPAWITPPVYHLPSATLLGDLILYPGDATLQFCAIHPTITTTFSTRGLVLPHHPFCSAPFPFSTLFNFTTYASHHHFLHTTHRPHTGITLFSSGTVEHRLNGPLYRYSASFWNHCSI